MIDSMWRMTLIASSYSSAPWSDAYFLSYPKCDDGSRLITYSELVSYSPIRHSGHTSFASTRASCHNPFEALALLRLRRMFIGFEGSRDRAEVYRAIASSCFPELTAASPSASSLSIHFLLNSRSARYPWKFI